MKNNSNALDLKKRKRNFITNLKPSEIESFYMDLKNNCETCKEIHKACRVSRNCSECDYRIFIKTLDKYYS